MTAYFVESGMLELLLLYCGILLLGMARLAGVAMLGYGVNSTVSIQHILTGCASLLHMAAGIFILKPHTLIERRSMRFPLLQQTWQSFSSRLILPNCTMPC